MSNGLLISINPQYADKIFNGEKKWEFRKVLPKQDFDYLLVYSTAPQSKVVGWVKVSSILAAPPDEVWKHCHKNGGVEKDFFDQYYSGKDKAIAFELGEVHLFSEVRDLSYYGVKTAPQSYVYYRGEL